MAEDRDTPKAGTSSESTAFSAALRHVWRMIILVVGATVVLIGVAMLVLPGPAIIVIPAGLAILATEFAWARRLLTKLKETAGFKKSEAGNAEQAGSRTEPPRA